MFDKLGLTDQCIPLQDRYDAFVLFINSKNNNVSELLAEELGVSASVIDVFFEISQLDPEEFKIIDKKQIDIGALFLIVRCEKEIRLKIYENSERLLSSSQPMKAIKTFIDDEAKVNLESLVKKISAPAWASIASYLKARNIDEGVMRRNFRSMLVTGSRLIKGGKVLSDPMIGWILQAIVYDRDKELCVFQNDELRNNFKPDFDTFKFIIENIDVYIS